MREEGFVAGSDDVRLTVEIMVPSSQVGRIIGKGGQNVRELQRVTGSVIKLPEQGASPQEDETTVHIIGPFFSVQVSCFFLFIYHLFLWNFIVFTINFYQLVTVRMSYINDKFYANISTINLQYFFSSLFKIRLCFIKYSCFIFKFIFESFKCWYLYVSTRAYSLYSKVSIFNFHVFFYLNS